MINDKNPFILKLLKNVLIVVISQQFSRVVLILLLPFFTPHLTKFDFGVWGLILTYTGLLGGIKDLGLAQMVVNSFFQRRISYEKIWRLYFGWLLIWSLAFALIQAIVLWYSLNFISVEEKVFIIGGFSFISIVIDPYLVFLFRFHQLNSKFNTIAVNSFLSGLISISVSYYLIVVEKAGYKGWVWALFIGQTVSFLHFLLTAIVRRIRIYPIFKHKPALLMNALRVGIPIIPHQYSPFILNASDRIVMDKMKVSINDIGLYSLGYNVGSLSDSIGSVVSMVLSPSYLRLFNEKKMMVVRTFTFYLQFFFLFVTILLCIWLRELFPLLIKNAQLQDSYHIAAIVFLSFSFRPLYVVPISVLGFYGKTASLWKITLIGGIINIVLNIILIPIFGFYIAAVTTFAAYLFIAVAGYFLKAFKEICKETFRIGWWVLFILTTSVLTYMLLDVNFYLKLFISTGILFLLVVNIVKLNSLNKEYRII